MKLPFTSEQFFRIFREYNQTFFPLQFLFYLLAIISIYKVIKRIPKSNRFAVWVLSFFWLWMGIAYHLLFFSTINKAAFLFGALFILQSFLFLIFGIAMRRIKFHFRFDAYGVTALVIMLYALVIYPLVSYNLNHIYPATPTFGLPCPTTIFTFGLLLITDKKTSLVIFIIPLIWSILGVSAAFNFGVKEDFGLLIAGLVTITMVLYRKRNKIQK